jgi:GTP pyrophosphokinase
MPAERRISVAWGSHSKAVFDVEISVTTLDQTGIITAIANVVQLAGISIQHFNASTNDEGTAIIYIALRVRDRDQLVDVMGKIRHIKGITSVQRVKGSVFGHKRHHGNAVVR